MDNKQTIELFEEYAKTKDPAIRNKIVEGYLYLAELIAKKYDRRGVDYSDLYQEAVVAIMDAIDKFDYTRGIQFATYLTPTIAGVIKNYFRDKSHPIKIPRSLTAIRQNAKKASEEYMQKNGKSPTVSELCKMLDISEELLVKAMEAHTVSLDRTFADEDDESENNMYSVIAKEDSGFEEFENKEMIASALEKLTDEERKIVSYRFVHNLSQSATAEKMGVSQMYISRREGKILSKLREILKD